MLIKDLLRIAFSSLLCRVPGKVRCLRATSREAKINAARARESTSPQRMWLIAREALPRLLQLCNEIAPRGKRRRVAAETVCPQASMARKKLANHPFSHQDNATQPKHYIHHPAAHLRGQLPNCPTAHLPFYPDTAQPPNPSTPSQPPSPQPDGAPTQPSGPRKPHSVLGVGPACGIRQGA